MKMRMIARQRGKREKKIKNCPLSSKNYLPVNSRSACGFASIELANRVEYKGFPGQLNVVLSWLYARHQNTDCYNQLPNYLEHSNTHRWQNQAILNAWMLCGYESLLYIYIYIHIYIYSHPQTDLFRSIRTHQCG